MLKSGFRLAERVSRGAVVSSRTGIRFATGFLKDLMSFGLVNLAGQHKDGQGQAVQRAIWEDLKWAAFRT